eukprot:CAMPEP_0185583274 /NCGR_PEP_ID=MMETSP0434-20130131/21424_1 /TAXON_ID=626734 ORGANISM="Favella taraikaensis, Strain Fe Narragansett Bay" /NCGR_SAMPLE_ID=MMETSP0434 /ASSEMBLY_ACC=CAM_ASM_000379 /LENGTH=77 /DNA_ID=CAMNT_0028202307 /DNA_START=426 /DNA_END=655 /DNA_ORIENTATION=-
MKLGGNRSLVPQCLLNLFELFGGVALPSRYFDATRPRAADSLGVVADVKGDEKGGRKKGHEGDRPRKEHLGPKLHFG